MNDINLNSKKIVILLYLGIAFVTILTIFILGSIWSSDSNTETEQNVEVLDEELSSYVFTNYDYDDVISKYFNEILAILSSENKQEIYELVSSDFLELTGYSEDELYEYLNKKTLIGNLFSCEQYIVLEHSNLGVIYEIQLYTSSNVQEKILVIEDSPNNYTISFDNYICENDYDYSITKSNLKITLEKIIEYTTKVYITLSLENTGNEEIIINNKNYYEDVFLTFTKSTTGNVVHTNYWLSGQELSLASSEKITKEFIFDISDLSSGVMNSIILYDVYNEATKQTSDLEYELFN